jgi:hypothetical protein
MFVPGGEPPPGARTYRSTSYTLIGTATMVLIVLVAAAVVLVAPEPAPAWALAAVAGGAVLAWLAYRCYLAPKVVVSAEGVLVVNPFQRRLVRWDDIERFDSRPGLTVVRRDGRTLTAWALPTPFSARATTSGETLADQLKRRLDAERPAAH